MTDIEEPENLRPLIKRAKAVWGDRSNQPLVRSKFLGSANLDYNGQNYWSLMNCGSFIAPNFFIEQEKPKQLSSLNCIEMGSDRDDRPLYYFLDTGKYVVASDQGLLVVATSTAEFFEVFVSYAEWVEKILLSHGPDAFTAYKFSASDLGALEQKFALLFKEAFQDSLWKQEIIRLKEKIE